jgi:hypothetical protein
MSTPRVIHAQPSIIHELVVTFDDGQKRQFSMVPYLQYSAFAALKDMALFNQARVAYGTVVWTDEIDISPDTLYLAGRPF